MHERNLKKKNFQISVFTELNPIKSTFTSFNCCMFLWNRCTKVLKLKHPGHRAAVDVREYQTPLALREYIKSVKKLVVIILGQFRKKAEPILGQKIVTTMTLCNSFWIFRKHLGNHWKGWESIHEHSRPTEQKSICSLCLASRRSPTEFFLVDHFARRQRSTWCSLHLDQVLITPVLSFHLVGSVQYMQSLTQLFALTEYRKPESHVLKSQHQCQLAKRYDLAPPLFFLRYHITVVFSVTTCKGPGAHRFSKHKLLLAFLWCLCALA